MNVIWLRVLRSTYRKEPAISFSVISGMVEAAIGGLGEHWLLMTFGLSTVAGAIALRGWQRRIVPNHHAPMYALPSQSSRPSLPLLTLPKQPPPSRKR